MMPFWRVFFRLGRGTLAGAVLFAACWVLYKQRAGMVLLHAGILLLLVGEFFTALFAVEATMTIREGDKATFFDRSQQFELVLTDTSDSEVDRVTTIPQSFLKPGKVVSVAALPFDLKVHARMSNSNRPVPLDSVSDGLRAAYPSYAGYGERLYVARSREVSGATGERNAPAVDVELLDRTSGASLGRYLLSIWFYPNFVNQIWDMPTTVLYEERAYELYFRNRREPAVDESGSPYAVTLLDFVHERYEGTQTPKDFSSEIRLVNEGDGIDRELRIWMNNPLRYAKRTFYQSGYLPDDEGTVLQVVRNDSWMIPYLSCMIVFIGMIGAIWTFFETNAQTGGVMKRVIQAFALFLFVLFFAAGLRPESSVYDIDGFAHLPMMDEGRRKPVDTFARNLLTVLSGKSSVRTGGREAVVGQ